MISLFLWVSSLFYLRRIRRKRVRDLQGCHFLISTAQFLQPSWVAPPKRQDYCYTKKLSAIYLEGEDEDIINKRRDASFKEYFYNRGDGSCCHYPMN